ncbi:MAG: hypothetical protein ACI82S_001976, partial [Patiriisocius sp.]
AITFSLATAVLHVFEQHWSLSAGSAIIALMAWHASFKRLR